MLEIITAVTTSITAILSVYIAYKSHRATIIEREKEKEEFSIKLLELHGNKNKYYLNKIHLIKELDIKNAKYNTLLDFIKNKGLQNDITQYIKNTEEFKEERIEQLSLDNTRILSKSISSSFDLLTQIEALQGFEHNTKLKRALIKYHGDEKTAYKVQNDTIQESAKKLLSHFKYD